MNDLQATGVIILLFALRCLAPLVITIAIGYLMNRMVDRWEAEEAAILEQKPQEAPVLKPAGEGKPSSITLPCWVMRNCDPEKRKNCPAYLQRNMPCWVARIRAEGALPSDCPGCPKYDHDQSLALI